MRIAAMYIPNDTPTGTLARPLSQPTSKRTPEVADVSTFGLRHGFGGAARVRPGCGGNPIVLSRSRTLLGDTVAGSYSSATLAAFGYTCTSEIPGVPSSPRVMAAAPASQSRLAT